MEIMQNTSSSSHRGLQMDMRGSSDDVIGGSWHSSSTSVPKAATNGAHTQAFKGKAKEVSNPLQRSPRRLASSKAIENVMRNSAPPAAATKSSSPAPADLSSEAIVNANTMLAASSSSPLRASPPRSLANGKDVSKRRVQSLSPLPKTRSNGIHQITSSAPLPPIDKSLSIIEEAEENQFHFKAAPDSDTSILPRPLPTLPYDASYLPLSPNNMDQLGHVLVPVALSGLSIPKGSGEIHKAARGHASSNKKILPGQDLEEHIVSQVPGQRSMPWGLQTTILENKMGGPKARTKMGTLKRTARRDINRRGKSMTTTPTLKIDDDLTSETDSPRLPLIEISEVVSTPASDTLRPQSAEAEEIEEEHVMQLDTLIDVDVKSESGMIASEADVSPQSSQAIQSSHNTDTIPKKRGRGRKSQMLNLASWPNSAEEPILTGESSSQEGVNNTARPREARKRLKLVGGYYNKLPRHREDLQKPTEIKSDTLIDNAGGSVSRGTSLAADDVVAEVCIVNGSQSEKILGMSSSPPPSSISEATAASNAPMSGPSRRMTPAAPLQSSPSKLKHASGEAVSADANNDVGNNEFCETCQGVGHFICCDGCPRSFHFACINPPLDIDELPNSIGDASDTWYCNVCRGAGKGKKKEKQNRGLFAPLIRHVEEENPTIFALPQDIRNYFKGVATANDGSYVNTAMLRPIKINKFGVVEEREPLRLKDKNGKPILCFQCGESAMPSELALSSPSRQRDRPARQAAKAATAAVFSQIAVGSAATEEKSKENWRSIVSCDFCNLHWHLDCLGPPLATMPSLSRKWMCPNHIEHVLPSERIPKSVANSTSVHELPLPSAETIGPGKHYRMRVVNDGQIDIIPDPMDTYTGPAHDTGGLAVTNGNGSSNGTSSSTTSGEKGWQELILPAYKGYPTVFGNHNNIKFKYRIPEKVIRLDFWSKAELQREKVAEMLLQKEQKSRKRGLDLLAIVANAASLENRDEVPKLKQKTEPKTITKVEAQGIVNNIFSQEADQTFIESGKEPVSLLRQSYNEADEDDEQMKGLVVAGKSQSSSTSSSLSSLSMSTASTQDASTLQNNVDIATTDDLDSSTLRSIKELIAFKGKDALLQFLLE